MDTTPMEEWNSASGLYTTEEADLMVPNDHQLSAFTRFGFSSTFLPGHESTTEMAFIGINEGPYYCSEIANNPYGDYFQHDINSYNEDSSDLIQASSNQNYLCDSLGFSVRDVEDNYLFLNIEGNEYLNQEPFSNDIESSGGSQSQMQLVDPVKDSQLNSESAIEITNPSGNAPARKRTRRNSGEVGKNKGVKRAKLVAASDNEDENGNACRKGQTSSSCSSGDDSNISMDSKGSLAIIQNGKPRATRGAATDPQSVYARKRREKINERLRTLQNLVPNGTKVDISTMLEEAVQYVKFLQLQIKLLSSDELWMYAPIAYNGIDMGLDFRG